MLSFYTTYEFLSNFLCNWHITHRRFFVPLYQPIHILREFWRFCQSSKHRFPPCLHPELSTTWNDHSIVLVNVQVSIFVTCLNFAGTGSQLWQHVAFVMTWYLAFKTFWPKAVLDFWSNLTYFCKNQGACGKFNVLVLAMCRLNDMANKI